MDKVEKIKKIIEQAQEDGLLWVGGYNYKDKNGSYELNYLKIKEAVEILQKIKYEIGGYPEGMSP